MADRIADPVIGWPAIARHLTRARCALARLAVTPPPRQLVVEPDTARMAVVRNPAIVRLRWSGRSVMASREQLDALAAAKWAPKERRTT